jgi:hypothetical protein
MKVSIVRVVGYFSYSQTLLRMVSRETTWPSHPERSGAG